MPTLLELQRAMRTSLVDRQPAAIVESLADGVGPDRLDIYRNTIFSGLTKALRLAYPAVERLVGADFFERAADVFITEYLPHAAYLDQYGDRFPDFLHRFPSAASLAYLVDVAMLEWAVNRALHAPDQKPLQLSQLADLGPEDQSRISFRAHPSISLLQSDFSVDDIWRAVLSGDDHALAALDLVAGPVFLLVERSEVGVKVTRMQDWAWSFLQALCHREPLLSAIDAVADADAPSLLAEHLAAGRFVAFMLDADEAFVSPEVA